MIEKNTTFFSEGARLHGTIYYPDDLSRQEPHPVLIINSGYQGFNEFYPRMFAGEMTQRGYMCFGFDYRGMADSEGEKGTVLIEQQVEDIRNAVTFMQTHPDVDERRIGLVGWGMGAANVILSAEQGKNVAGVAALNGFYDGERWLKSVHSYDEWTHLLDEVRQDRIRRVLDGESRLGDTFAHYPLDPQTRDYVGKELAQVHGFGHPTRLQFTESIIALKVERTVRHLASTPVFIGHGSRNTLHPYAEAEALYDAAPSPKTLYTIDGRHNDFMYSEHPEFVLLCDHLREFFETSFAVSASPGRTVSA